MSAGSRESAGRLNELGRRGYSMLAVWDRRLSMSRSALSVRLVVLACGVAVIAIPANPKQFPALVIAIGTLLAVLSPARSGAALAVAAGIGGWFACYGVHGSPPLARTLCFAAALYLLHSATALAAAVATSSRLDPTAAWRWAARSGLHLAIAGLLVAVSYPLTSLAGRWDAQAAELAGAGGAVAVLAVVVWLFSRTPG